MEKITQPVFPKTMEIHYNDPMKIPFAKGLGSHLAWAVLPLGGAVWSFRAEAWGVSAALLVAAAAYSLFMLYFFRDPERVPPEDPALVVAGADGWVRSVEDIDETTYLCQPTVRISIYLTPWDVHVNRSPIQGAVTRLDYSPGRHVLTRNPQSSEVNEHSSILIEGDIPCLVRQIVGPLVRRVVAWLDEGQALARGERIGMMKFGSRLDVYLPRDRVEVVCRRGDRTTAGVTPIARLRKDL